MILSASEQQAYLSLFKTGSALEAQPYVIFGTGTVTHELLALAREYSLPLPDFILDYGSSSKDCDGVPVRLLENEGSLPHAVVLGSNRHQEDMTRRLKAHFGTPPQLIDLEQTARILAFEFPPPLSFASPDIHKEGPRILMLSIIPPFPAVQGNRRIISDLLEHFLDGGYAIDMVLQCNFDHDLAEQYAESHPVRIYGSDPRSQKWLSDQYSLRKHIKDIVMQPEFRTSCISSAENIFRAATCFHPFDYVSEHTTILAKHLLEDQKYSFILCNYAFMTGVIKELRNKVSLPPSVVITHDALSRLPEQALFYGIDTKYRASTKEDEAFALNHADLVAAITSTEKLYFQKIGVTSPIVVCEHQVDDLLALPMHSQAFDSKIVVFIGSSNPLNTYGLQDFIDNSWPRATKLVPNATLHIAGSVCSTVTAPQAGVVSHGTLPATELKELMLNASLAVNPVPTGTGLKIKTVEYMAAGLPAVVSPAAAEGLEELHEKAFFVAKNSITFANQCAAFLTNKTLWSAYSNSARQISQQRFNAKQVYSDLDSSINLLLSDKPA